MKKKKIVLFDGCFSVDTKKYTITRYYQDKKGGGFRDKIGGFKNTNTMWDFVSKRCKQ